MAVMPVISQNLVVVKTKVGGDLPMIEDAYSLGIISGLGFSGGSGNKDNADGVLARIAAGVRIGVELAN